MILVGHRMMEMERYGLESQEWNKENCIMWKKPCMYFTNHCQGVSTLEDSQMVQVEDYRGLKKEIE